MLDKLITYLYDPNANLPSDDEFYDEVIKEIELYFISPQVYSLLKEKGELGNTPLFFQTRLKQKYQETLYQNLFIKNQTDHIIRKFEEEQIEVIPLKGVYFAEKYFGHLGARGTSDIDILVKRKDINKAIEVVKSMDFKIEEEFIPSHFHVSFSREIPGSAIPLTVEIHWDILKEKTANFNIQEFWGEAVRLERFQFVKTLSDYHTFYMICLHGWRHNLDSPKHFLDIIQIIDVVKDRISYETLFKDAKRHQTYKRMVRTLSIVYRQYSILDKIKKLSSIENQFKGSMSSRLEQEKKGIKKYFAFMDYQFFSYDSVWHSLSEIRSWLLPNRFEVISQLKETSKQRSYFYSLLMLYKQRCNSVVEVLGS
ncbi:MULTISPECIES: nucleotidyltransferase domain-containing protein [Priestia]|uniref:nucleotidyltransferase domain-containing protein n=1 Tax=Priestia TaxID=2800373 RepID=UPI002D804AF0|nr:nucleotidyltransferase family protein [Priestia megaterium]MEB4885980.1 nucleotidyltransferase family protein [Priestia megaterium]MED5118415.1 nucleotidyltransferase family protein [Priestia megaterium]